MEYYAMCPWLLEASIREELLCLFSTITFEKFSPCNIWWLMNQTPLWFVVEMFELDYLLYQENCPKGLSPRRVRLTSPGATWLGNSKGQFVRTDKVFISACLLRQTTSLLNISRTGLWAWWQSVQTFIPELSTFPLTKLFHTCAAEELLETLAELSTQMLGAFDLGGKSGERLKAATPTCGDGRDNLMSLLHRLW